MVYKKGDRVQISGKGHTANWRHNTGTVVQQVSKTSIEVVWDGTHFGDEMQLDEIRPMETGDHNVPDISAK